MFVAYGSSTFELVFGDIDLLTDSEEELNNFISARQMFITENIKIKDNHYKIVYKGIILEIIVVQNQTAHHKIYNYSINEPEDAYLSNLLSYPIHSVTNELNAALYYAHLILPHNKWKRHMKHFHVLKSHIHYSKEYLDVFNTHRAECLLKAKKHPVLMSSKDEFFKPTNGMIYDHDSIHEAIAIGTVPAYTLMKDGEVYCSKKLWDQLTEIQKTNCVQEEAGVLALERSIIPSIFGKFDNSSLRVNEAYNFALYKICTTITSGWFRDECIKRYQEVLYRLDKYKFFDMFMQKASEGKIKLALS